MNETRAAWANPPIKVTRRRNHMKIRKNSLVLTAAFTGLLGGTMLV
jgi:hypothetical protein